MFSPRERDLMVVLCTVFTLLNLLFHLGRWAGFIVIN